MAVNYGSLPFAEALEFFRHKLNLPTAKWDDILGAAHDRAFVVAGAMQADLLMDLRAAVDKAIAEGTTLETFRKDFKKIVAERDDRSVGSLLRHIVHAYLHAIACAERLADASERPEPGRN